MAKRTPATDLSRRLLRSEGYTVDTVERWIAASRTRKDLYGFGDLLAVNGDEVRIVQTTSYSNMPARVRKARELPEFRLWLQGDGRTVEFHGWREIENGEPSEASDYVGRKWQARRLLYTEADDGLCEDG